MRHMHTETTYVVQERRRGALAVERGDWADCESSPDLDTARQRLEDTITHALGDRDEWRMPEDFRVVMRAVTTLESTLINGHDRRTEPRRLTGKGLTP